MCRISSFLVACPLLGFAACAPQTNIDTKVAVNSFDLADDSEIFYTDDSHGLYRVSREGDCKTIIVSKTGIGTLSVSEDGNQIALSEYPTSIRDEMTISIYSVKRELRQTHLLIDSFYGSIPEFSSDGSSVIYCRPTRQVRGSWTDFELWEYSIDLKMHTKLISERFFSINGICVTGSTHEIYLSGIQIDGTNEAVEGIFKVSDGVLDWISKDKPYRMSSPSLTQDFKKLIYVSDQRKSFHYEVVTQELSNGNITFVTDGTKIRYATDPKQDSQGNWYFLGTNEFLNGRPMLQLHRITPDGNSIEALKLHCADTK